MTVASPRTRTLGIGLALLSSLTLTGCVFAEGRPDTMQVFNSSDTTVVVAITGTGISQEVAPGGGGFPSKSGSAWSDWGGECIGDGIVVSDLDGNIIATFDGPACGSTTLNIWKDDSVTVDDVNQGRRTPEPLPTGTAAAPTPTS